MGRSTVNSIVSEVVAALVQVLKTQVETPRNSEAWMNVAKDFYNMWNYPMLLGALDGKHVNIQAPSNSGSHNFNYKQRFSVVLLALADAHLRFLYIDVGTNGRVSDGGVYAKSMLKQAMDGNHLNMPLEGLLPGTSTGVPYHMVGDDAFPMSVRMLKPFPGQNLDSSKRIFNYRLSRARRVIENAFGVLSVKFRVLKTDIVCSLSNLNNIIFVCCCLHNYLINKRLEYFEPEVIDREDLVTRTLQRGTHWDEGSAFTPIPNVGGRSPNDAVQMRDTLKDYFNDVGSVAWQRSMVEPRS